MQKLSIIGAGLTGTLLALYLAKLGYQVDIYERRADMRQHDVDGGRSINLALSARGIHALHEMGLADKLLKHAVPMYGRMIHAISGDLHSISYAKTRQQCLYAMGRNRLNQALLAEAAHYSQIRMHFQQRLIRYDVAQNTLTLADETQQVEAKSKQKKIPVDFVFGADGAFSAVRESLQQQKQAEFQVETAAHGYKELTMAPFYGAKLQRHYLHIWPRKQFMLIALPNPKGSFTCTLFMSHQGPVSFAHLQTETEIIRFFQQQFPDALVLLPNLIEQWQQNPISKLVTVQGGPWQKDTKCLLLGDAAHAMLPFFGQGMNCAFEDCSMLNGYLQQFAQDWPQALKAYKQRKLDTDAISAMSYANYIEMRDLSGDPKFQLQKQVEQELTQRYADVYVSKYQLVSFTRKPYTFAQQCGKLQEKLLAELTHNIDSISAVDWNKADRLVQEYARSLCILNVVEK